MTLFNKENKGNIKDYYEAIWTNNTKLGDGAFSEVFKAIHKETKQTRAIKVLPKSKIVITEAFKNEIGILETVDHPNIIRLYETFEDEKNLYLVLELCEGGELFHRIGEKGHYTENEARKA